MFDLLTNIIKKVSKLDGNKIVRQSLNNTSIQQDILDLNKQDQLYNKGIDAKGDSLGEYSLSTIDGTSNFEGKKQKGQRFDHITLNDTGDFYNSFIFKNNKDNFEIEADTLKEGTDLIDNFGKDILGITDENKSKLAGWLIEPIQKNILAEIRK